MRPGQTVGVKPKILKGDPVQAALAAARGRGYPAWLMVDADGARGTVTSLPRREEITMPIQEQLIVELYSK